MQNHKCAALLVLVALSALGCASAPTAPPDWLPDPKAVGSDEHGGWIEMECTTNFGKAEMHGELLAVDNERVYVLLGDAMRSIPIDSVREARLTWYDSHGGAVAGLAALGALSTVSNGVYLVITAPLWMIGGTIAAHSQFHAPVVKTPKKAWDEVRPFARFPQGLPPSFVASTPTIAATVPEPVLEPEPTPPPPLPPRTEGGTRWGFAVAGGATRYPDSDDSGLGVVIGLNVSNKWATGGLRMAVSGRDDPYNPHVPAADGESTLLDLGLLLGVRAEFGRFELAARAGPAVWGFGVEDFVDFSASFAAQGELFIYPWQNVGIGTIVAYNDNDFLDFYMVTIGIAVGPR